MLLDQNTNVRYKLESLCGAQILLDFESVSSESETDDLVGYMVSLSDPRIKLLTGSSHRNHARIAKFNC